MPEVEFTSLSHRGEAVGRLPDGRAVFVPFALPGERAEIRLVEVKDRYARGSLVHLLRTAPERVQPRCKHYGVCGGCQLQHLAYRRQVEAKTAMLRDQLIRIGRIAEPPVRPAIESPHPWNYRNHVQFHLAHDDRPGYLPARDTNVTGGVVSIDECHLPDEAISRFWPLIAFEGRAALERISVRSGGDHLMLVLESETPLVPELEIEASVSVAHVHDGETVIQAGEDHIEILVQGRAFRVSPTTFFQVNVPVAEKMVDQVLERIPAKSELIIDAYCGAGLFSAFLAPRCRKLIAIESSPAACEDFTVNLDEFDNVDLYEDAVERVLQTLEVRPDVILVDPPRSGLERGALESVLKLDPGTIIYVSCDSGTLARDTRHLLEAGLRLESITPFDMFPQTYHIESISVFTR